MRHIVPAAIVVGALGCVPSQTVTASDVLTLTACPADAGVPCSKSADGASLITVQACIPPSAARPLATGLSVTIQTSAGTWQVPSSAATPTVYTGAISGDGCIEPTLIAPSSTLYVRIDAAMSGYSQTMTIALAPATLQAVELTAIPASLGTSVPNEIALQATVRAAGLGVPTSGTTVTFVPTASPATGDVAVWPATSVIDATGQAKATLVVGPGVRSVTITVTATGPTRPTGGMASTATGTIVIESFVPDAGAVSDAPGD